MSRTFTDDMDDRWTVSLEALGDPTGTVDEEVLVRFTPEDDGTDELEIRAVGPVRERFEELDHDDLQLAVEAAGNDLGFLFLHPSEERLWWVREGSDTQLTGEGSLTFATLDEEIGYDGMLARELSSLSEEELKEMLDEARRLVRG